MKKIIYIILGLIVLYYVVRLATCREKFQENKELLNKIDSLNKVSKQLQEEQKKITARDSSFNQSIVEIDHKIDSVHGSKTVIEKHFHTQTQVIPSYTPKQIDSFFKKRYNY